MAYSNRKKYIGAHVSAAGGLEQAPLRAQEIGATGFALFTKNQRQWFSKALTGDEIDRFKAACATAGYRPESILPHDSYLINLGHPEDEGLAKSRAAFTDEMRRCELLGLDRLNFHPGSHLQKIGEEESLDRIAASINLALEKTHGVTAVIENTAGQGSNLGYRFEHLRYIIDRVGIVRASASASTPATLSRPDTTCARRRRAMPPSRNWTGSSDWNTCGGCTSTMR